MPMKSKFPDAQLPETDLYSFHFKRPDRPPFPEDKIVLRDADDYSRTYTFAQVRQASKDFGIGLKNNFSFKKGDVLALVSPNDVDFPIIVFGTLWAGAIVSPANPAYTVDEMAYQFKDSGSKVIACHSAVLDSVKKACSKVGIPESNIILLGAQKDPQKKIKHWTSVRNLEGTSRYRTPKINPKEDLAFIPYSSGTTGRSKGVRLTHYNMTSNIVQVGLTTASGLSWDGSKKIPGIPDAPSTGDKELAVLPFFHIYGLNVLVFNAPFYFGCETVVMAKFEIEKWCRVIQDLKITHSYLVPPIVLGLAKHPIVDKYDLKSLRVLCSGAAPMTRELIEALYKRKGVRVHQAYGLTECSPSIFSQRWEDWQTKIGSTGMLCPNLETKICKVGEEGGERSGEPQELATGEDGEIYVRGPNVFKGYHNNVAATQDCLSEDGWFRTGDVGHIDADGSLYITDRVKELIKYKGFQVPPAELEGYLMDHPLVEDVCVVGVESEVLGTEVPRAYIVRKGGMSAVEKGDDEKVIKWMNQKVVNYKRLRGGVKFVESVPKSASGKLLRRMLKDQAKKEMQEMEKSGKIKARL